MTDPYHDQPERADASAALEAADLWRCDLVTRSGLVLRIRPVRPEGEAALSDFFSRLAPADLRFRFLGGVREVSHERLVAMTRVDHRATEHFLAFAEDGGTIIAAAMVACDPLTKKAEVAISVRAEDKHKGVAWEMLRHAARYAQARGAEALESLESRENREAIELEREQGFLAFPYPDDPTLILIRKDLRLP